MREFIAGLMVGFAFTWWVFTVFAIRRWYKHFRDHRGKPRLRDAWKPKR